MILYLLFSYCYLSVLKPKSKYVGRVEIWGSVSALSAEAYTTTLYEMVYMVKEGGRAVHPIPDWADFSIMREVAIAALCVLYSV